MSRRLRPIAIAAVVAGLLGGIAAALLIPTTRAGDARGATASGAPAIAPGANTVLRVRAPHPAIGDVGIHPSGPIRIEARAADPLGGPDWAVRVFDAERVTRAGRRRPGVDPVVGRPLCAQLGRIHDGRFGWLAADGTFRPLRAGAQSASASLCTSRRPDLGRHPALSTLSPITEPAAPAARVKSTVAWGLAGTAARSVTLDVAGRSVTADPSLHHAFLVVTGPEVDQRAITARIAYRGEPDARLPHLGLVPGARPGRLAARAPDPNGGLPYAMTAAKGPGDQWCRTTGGRVVGDRVGGVDYVLDVLTETRISGWGTCASDAELAEMYRRHPVLLGFGGGSGDRAEEGGDTGGAGRVARRTQRGQMTFSGTAAPGVVAVTLETPRDVRTLIPSGPARAILAVYDGRFPTGEVRITARFKDGRVQHDRLPDVGM